MNARINYLERASELIGVTPESVRLWLESAGWSREQFIAAVAGHDHEPDWFGELKRAARASVVEVAATRIGPPSFSTLTRQRVLDLVKRPVLRRLIETYDGGPVVIFGPTELGKSITACELLREQCRRARTTALATVDDPRRLLDPHDYRPECRGHRFRHGWITAADLAIAQRESKLGEREDIDIRLAKTEPLVVIDDITWPSARDDVTLDVLAARYDAGLPTIVTAGYTKQQLLQRFGDAAVRRMLELRGAKGILVDLNGGSK